MDWVQVCFAVQVVVIAICVVVVPAVMAVFASEEWWARRACSWRGRKSVDFVVLARTIEPMGYSPDDGIVYEIDRQKCATFSSLRTANHQLTELLATQDRRFEEALDQILILKRTVEQQAEEIEAFGCLLYRFDNRIPAARTDQTRCGNLY